MADKIDCFSLTEERDEELELDSVLLNIRAGIGATPYVVIGKNSIVNSKRFSDIMRNHNLSCPTSASLESWLKGRGPVKTNAKFYEQFISAFAQFFQIDEKWLFQNDKEKVTAEVMRNFPNEKAYAGNVTLSDPTIKKITHEITTAILSKISLYDNNYDMQTTGIGWESFTVNGSSLHTISGIASTIQNPNNCSQSWFSGETTVILGSGETKEKNGSPQTVASWEITLHPSWLKNLTKGFLAIGCLRYFGGLHSQKYGAQVEIMFNNRYIDGFGLMIKPENHTDYFHRIPLPSDFPIIYPLSACQTIYAWPIMNYNLSPIANQTITIKIDNKVSWDIDYIAIVCSK
ncbi:MAG: hypothetical protein HQK65_01995 [Desulfamplus sp.]|nr:hypothetical protein [Desulfamplus sp.]